MKLVAKFLANGLTLVTLPLWWPAMLCIELVQVAFFPSSTPLGCAVYDKLNRLSQGGPNEPYQL
jgi:hypothetical protein